MIAIPVTTKTPKIAGGLIYFCIVAALVGVSAFIESLHNDTGTTGRLIDYALIGLAAWAIYAVQLSKPFVFTAVSTFLVTVFAVYCLAFVGGQQTTVFLAGAIKALILMAYFVFSKRVKATYGRNLWRYNAEPVQVEAPAETPVSAKWINSEPVPITMPTPPTWSSTTIN